MKKAKIMAGAVLAVLVFLSGCEEPNYTTIEWEPDGEGYLQYMTDDPANGDSNQIKIISGSTHTPMNLTITVKKMKGYGEEMFGMVFGYQDDNNYYWLVIDTLGNYRLLKRKNGTNTTLKQETHSSYLDEGFEEDNKIRVYRANPSANNTISIVFNDHNATPTTITDGDFKTGLGGFFVRVGKYNTDVRCKMLDPAVPTP